MNGRGSGRSSPSTVTWRSSMASSSADWVLGVARLISSAEHDVGEDRRRAGTRTRCVCWLQTETPVTSDGSRSGVNWMRWKRAVDRAGERLGQHRLADAGHVLDQQVALAEQGDERQPDFGCLPTMTRSTFATTRSAGSWTFFTVSSISCGELRAGVGRLGPLGSSNTILQRVTGGFRRHGNRMVPRSKIPRFGPATASSTSDVNAPKPVAITPPRGIGDVIWAVNMSVVGLWEW